MKKVIYSIGILAAAAMAFSSCEKETSAPAEPQQNLVTISFTAEKAGTDTRTAILEEGTSSVSYKWTDEDIANIKLFTVTTKDGKETLTQIASPTVTKVSDTKLTIEASVAPGATYTFRALLAGEWTSSGNPKVKATQNPNGTTSFDPKADILVSDDLEVEVGESDETSVSSGTLEMVFRRKIAVNKMTLKNMVAGEKVSKVSIQSSENLVGYYSGGSMTGNGKGVTVEYDNVAVPEGGQFPVYFTTIPETGHSLTISVTTDKYLYSKSFAAGKTVDFNLGEFTKFNVALPEGTPVTAFSGTYAEFTVEDAQAAGVTTNSYTEFSSYQKTNGDIWNGKVSFYNGGFGLRNASSTNDSYLQFPEFASNIATVTVTLSLAMAADKSLLLESAKDTKTGSIASITTVADQLEYVFDLSSSNVKTAYLRADGAAAYVKKVAIVTENDDRDLLDQPASIYADVDATVPNKISVLWDAVADAEGYILSYTPQGGTKKSITIDDGAAEAYDIEDLAYSTEYTISIIAFSDPYFYINSSELVYGSTVTTGAAPAGATTTYTYVFNSKSWGATLDGAAANWTSDKDASATEAVRGVSIQAAATGAGATSPIAFTGITNVTISLAKSNKGVGSVAVKVGDETIGTVSSFSTTSTASSFDVSNLSGSVSFVVTCSTSTIYVKEISITASGTGGSGSTAHKITLNSVTGGTIKAYDASDNEISEAEEGDVVKLVATASTNYTFDSWSVTGATVADASSATTTFTMETSAVTVGAKFNKTGGGSEPQEVSIKYSGSTTNMTGNNDAATVGLDATKWSVVGDKGGNSNYPGLNKSSYIALYYAASGSNTITVSSLDNSTINSIKITYTGTSYNNGKVYVGESEITASSGSYPINSTSFVITNGNTSNIQVRISEIVINYTPAD